jgi:hypothetical protein
LSKIKHSFAQPAYIEQDRFTDGFANAQTADPNWRILLVVLCLERVMTIHIAKASMNGSIAISKLELRDCMQILTLTDNGLQR